MRLMILLIGLSTFTLSVFAENANGPVFRAIAALELTEDQKQPFGDLMQDFFADIRSTIRRELQKTNGRDKSKTIRRRIEKLFEKLDHPVSEILTEDQWGPYLRYKQAVATHIRTTVDLNR